MRRFTIALLLAALCCSCEPDTYTTSFAAPPGDGTKARVSLLVTGDGISTKSSLGDPSDVESRDSGCQLLVYFHDTGLLEGVYTLPSRSTSVELTAGRPLDLYVVGNMWYLDRESGRKAGYADLLGDAFPTGPGQLTDREAFPEYRFDGADVTSTLRTETFAEVATYGIPYAGSNTSGVSVRDGGSIVVEARRLFARVDVTIDHTGIDGGEAGNFRNSRLLLRQASCRVHPFLPMKAEGPEDILPESDYEPSMANDRQLTFTLYVPENRQAAVAFSNSDPSGKTPEGLASQGLGGVAPYLTYVEYGATADVSAGGYGGEFTYRFFLGGNATDSFDIERGRRYDVRLGFRAGSLFDPYWKVDGTLDDRRTLYFAADQSGERPLSEGQTVAVRKNRPASIYVYFNRSGVGGANEAASHLEAWHDGYDPTDLAHSAFRYTFSGDPAASGITPSYDASTGEITLAVTDPARFTSGKDLTMTLTLYPGGETRTVTVRTMDNLSASIPDLGSWHVAMKRTMALSGFAGGNIRMSVEGADGSLKTSGSGTAAFLGGSPVDITGTTTDLYAFKATASGRIHITSDDPLNDGEFVFDFYVRNPVLRTGFNAGVPVRYTVRGDATDLSYVYEDEGGNSIPQDRFDEGVYSQTLQLHPEKSDSFRSAAFASLGFSDAAGVQGHTLSTYLVSPKGMQDAMGPIYEGGQKFYESRQNEALLPPMFRLVSADGLHSTAQVSGVLPNIWQGGIRGVWYDTNHDGIETPEEIQLVTLGFGDLEISPMHDYSTLNQTILPEHLRQERSKNFDSMQLWFGVRSEDDLMVEAVPRSVESPENKSLSGRFVRDHGTGDLQMGSLHFEFEENDTKHSFGRHRVYVGVENAHSHERVSQHLGDMDVNLYIGLAADLYVAGVTDGELEIDFGGVLVANEANVPPLIDRYLTDNNIKVGYDAQPTGTIDKAMLPGTQGGYSASDIRAENQVARPVWESDHRTDEDFDYPYMKLFVSGNDYLLGEYQSNRELLMEHFFPRIRFIDNMGIPYNEVTLKRLNGYDDPMTDDFIHLITSNFYDPTNFVRGWLDKVMVQ